MAAAKISKERWLKAIEDSAGVTDGIAKILGLGRSTVYRASKNYRYIAEAIEEQQAIAVDLALVQIRQHIADGNAKVCMWYLDRKAKDQGFGHAVAVDAKVDAKVKAEMIVYMPDDGREDPQ